MIRQDLPGNGCWTRPEQDEGQAWRGRVDLVGAGPGDPGLLTLHAAAALAEADVLLHDRLIPEEVLAMVGPGAERIHVGKARARHYCEQNERGGEEAEALAAAGVPVRIVPGITAASGCAAYAGIPLTHRDHAYRCQFVTAHRRAGDNQLDWSALVQPQQTVVVYMGLHGLDRVCAEMVEAGAATGMPAALVERGTLVSQRVFAGTLGDLPQRVAGMELQSPAVLVVGEVVRLREAIAPEAATPIPGEDGGD